MMQELENGYDEYGRLEALPTPLSKIDPPYAYRDHSLNYRKFFKLFGIFAILRISFELLILNFFFKLSLENVDMGGIVCVCMIAISLMLIYGAVKYKPSHLLPFFCLQLFDFAITT